jgi:hypothetical protein
VPGVAGAGTPLSAFAGELPLLIAGAPTECEPAEPRAAVVEVDEEPPEPPVTGDVVCVEPGTVEVDPVP